MRMPNPSRRAAVLYCGHLCANHVTHLPHLVGITNVTVHTHETHGTHGVKGVNDMSMTVDSGGQRGEGRMIELVRILHA